MATLTGAATRDERKFLTSLKRRAKRRDLTLDTVEAFAEIINSDDETERLVAMFQRASLKDAARRTPPARNGEAGAYERHRQAAAARQSEKSASGRDIGPIPPVEDPERREACRRDLKLYLETYHAPSFPKPFSDIHLTLIRLTQAAIVYGGTQAVAMPRGWGKTTTCTHAVKFAALYGFVPFVVLIGAEDGKAVRLLTNIKTDLETNELLLADFPEICFPVWKLERVANRAKGQLCCGRNTYIEWSANWIAFPTTTNPDGTQPPGSGVVIAAAGLEAAVRGIQFQHPATAAVVRPKLALIDDFQTDKSARSVGQCDEREKLISQAILGLAGPDEQMSALATCTVIKPRDAADRLLNSKTHPDWRGIRGKTLEKLPDDVTRKRKPDDESPRHWEQWNKLRVEALQDKTKDRTDFSRALGYYKKNRKAMQAGAVANWGHAVKSPWSDALETAMALFFRDRAAFFAEGQNEPDEDVSDTVDMLSAEDIAAKITGRPSFEVPQWATLLVAHIDVQKRCLVYGVEAANQEFRGRFIDYGTHPKPHKSYWHRSNFEPTIADVHRTGHHRSDVKRALFHLLDLLFSPGRFKRPDGQPVGINLCLIDASYQLDAVLEVCAETPHRGRVLPLRGRAPKPGTKRLGEYEQREGMVVGGVGKEWIDWPPKSSGVRMLTADVNEWKSNVAARWSTNEANPGGLALFGSTQAEHSLFADHVTAELPVDITRQEETRTQWELIPNRDNDHLDNVVGCSIALSRCGAELPGTTPSVAARQATAATPKRRRRRVKV